MKLSTKGRYGVMAMAVLAEKEYGDIVPISVVADSQEISINYLEQIFNKLRRGGLVKSARGIGGGYYLTRKPHEITVLDIMKAVGESFQTTRCDVSGSIGCMKNGTARCATHDLWAELGNVMAGYLDTVTLEMIKNRSVRKKNIYHFLPEQQQRQKEKKEFNIKCL